MNDKALLREVYFWLKENSIDTYVFGGWAEELQKLIEPRNHKDIDLLYIENNWKKVDNLLENKKFNVIKKFPHKRAFLYKGTLIEIFLVINTGNDYETNFFSKYIYTWPESTFLDNSEIKICSKESLTEYRKNHNIIHQKSI